MHLPRLTLIGLVTSSALALAATGCGQGDTGGGGPGYGGGGVGGVTGPGSSPGSSGSGGNGATGSGSSGGSASSSGSSGGNASSSGSSGGSSSGGGGGMTITANTTWNDGQMLAESVTIGSGVTVTIAPGATITVASGVAITVDGTLTASSTTKAASLTGTGWTGIVVASGGTLNLTGVDISGASTPLDVQKGATSAEYDSGTINGATTPFKVEVGGALGSKSATVTGTLGSASIGGSFTASKLNYNSNGNEGIITTDPTAQLSIEDSTLQGTGPTGDMLISQGGAAKFHIAYTTISNVHCGFHFDAIGEFDISYINDESNAFGFMLYGSSGAGPFTVSYSNIVQNSAYAYDAQGTNAPITFSNDYVTGTTNPGTVVTVTNAQNATVPGTGPRTQ
ncbi:MAG TPA: hypothetical protein VMI75_24645 [Polyangiaceae bacterium]|nr:hypothetical protein [Polyangiaceae bacterium]